MRVAGWWTQREQPFTIFKAGLLASDNLARLFQATGSNNDGVVEKQAIMLMLDGDTFNEVLAECLEASRLPRFRTEAPS